MGRRNLQNEKKIFSFDEKIVKFDEKAVKFEEIRNFGVRGMSLGMIFANSFVIFMMIVPLDEMFREEGWFWVLCQGCVMLVGVYLRMKWLLGLMSGGRLVPWKEYLKYVPVDWQEYRLRRIWVLMCYTGKMFLCYAILQACVQLFSAAVMGTGFHWEEIVYAAAMCVAWILVPGMFMIWRWC